MNSRSMRWDQGLAKKFCATGHLRLLNQLRYEIKAKPIVRLKKRSLQPEKLNNLKQDNNSNTRINMSNTSKKTITDPETTSDIKKVTPLPSQNRNQSNFAETKDYTYECSFNNHHKQETERKEPFFSNTYKEDNNKTFRERLNDVDMR